MKNCTYRAELLRAIRAGHWPLGCTAELRDHVAACSGCADEARTLTAFASAHHTAMQSAPMQSPGLLWWKAQLRRRHEAMTKLERPGFAISTAAIVASIVLLLTVFVTWKGIHWVKLLFSSAGMNSWAFAAVALVLCGFGVTAVFVGIGAFEEPK